MKADYLHPAILSFLVLLASGCGGGNSTSKVAPTSSCVASSKPEFAYALTSYSVSMYTVDSCTGSYTAATPASIATGYAFPQQGAEQMVVDPGGRFAYVANLVSNASPLSTISMYTINSTTGVLTPTAPATVPTGWFPQEIAIDPQGRFVYTANTDASSVSMFTINQTTGVLTPTTPATVSTLVPGEPISDTGFLTTDPAGRFLYVTASLSEGSAVFMYSIDQTTGLLTPTSPAMVYTGGIPFQIVVAPSGKFAYVVDNLSSSGDGLGVWQFSINSTTGVLTQNTPAAVGAGNGPTAVAVDPTGKFAYVVNRGESTLSMYTIDSNTGNLTLNKTSAAPTGFIATGYEPFRIAFDPTGKFVYVTNESSAASVYKVNNDGTLSSVGTTGVTTGSLSTAFAVVSQ